MAEKYVKLNDIIDALEHAWGYEGMREDLEKLPTADVVEVKHGEWIDDGDCFHCSCCSKTYQLGCLQTIYDVKRCWKYCANCGAKMDGNK